MFSAVRTAYMPENWVNRMVEEGIGSFFGCDQKGPEVTNANRDTRRRR